MNFINGICTQTGKIIILNLYGSMVYRVEVNILMNIRINLFIITGLAYIPTHTFQFKIQQKVGLRSIPTVQVCIRMT